MPGPARTERLNYIEASLNRYGYLRDPITGTWTKGPRGYSYRLIAQDVARQFQTDIVQAATIKADLDRIFKIQASRLKSDRNKLIRPEDYPEWRATYFITPEGTPYETPQHQLALFWLSFCLSQPDVPLPDWVVDYLDIAVIADWVRERPQGDPLFAVVLAPPRFGKTEGALHTYLFSIAHNPNLRIIWGSLNLDIARLGVGYVRNELESNLPLAERYGPFAPPLRAGHWSDSEFTVVNRTIRMKSPTMVALGRKSGVLSRDADIIHLDDIVDLKASEDPVMIERTGRWLTSQLVTRREKRTPIVMTGSHQPSPSGDLYFWIEENIPNVRFIRLRAHDYARCPEDATPHRECLLWPSQWPLTALTTVQESLKENYEVVYNQDPSKGKTSRFARSWFDPDSPDTVMDRNLTWGLIPLHCEIPMLAALGFDPAFGASRDAAETGIACVGVCSICRHQTIIRAISGRMPPEDHSDILLEWGRTYRPLEMRIEINAAQVYLARNKELKAGAKALGITIHEWLTTDRKMSNDVGIGSVAKKFSKREMSIPLPDVAHPDYTAVIRLVNAFTRYPRRPDDVVNAVWLGSLGAAGLFPDAESDNLWGPQLAPAYMRDGYLLSTRRK